MAPSVTGTLTRAPEHAKAERMSTVRAVFPEGMRLLLFSMRPFQGGGGLRELSVGRRHFPGPLWEADAPFVMRAIS